MRRWLAARPATEMRRGLALEEEALLQHGGELGRAVGVEVLVVAFALAGQQRVEGVVSVVVPLRVEGPGGAQMARGVALVLAILELRVPVLAAPFGREVEQLPQRPGHVDMARVLASLRPGEQHLGVKEMADLAVAPMTKVLREDTELLARVLTAIPMGRRGGIQDVSDAVCFLASDAAAYMTGETIDIDGAVTME